MLKYCKNCRVAMCKIVKLDSNLSYYAFPLAELSLQKATQLSWIPVSVIPSDVNYYWIQNEHAFPWLPLV